ncbi:MAG TPA: carbohydrate kinase family protein [Desulfobacterales bacterium]|nr:carbohydrate kinase family protein [Desulfobacterales bacterium]
MKNHNGNYAKIVTIGSGNIEYVMQLGGEFRIGKKNQVDSTELLGGSCINYSLRLMNAGFDVFPIPSIGKDLIGLSIQNKLLNTGFKNGASKESIEFIKSEDFFVPNINSPHSTIIVHNGSRTIFSQKLVGMENFREHVQNRLGQIETLIDGSPHAIMIGHIYSDALSSEPGKVTKTIIGNYWKKSLLFANFGASQLQHGKNFWKEDLRCIDLFQLNLEEMKRFFNNGAGKTPLLEIVDWLRENSITAVITLDKFGAIGTYKNGSDGLILASPIRIGKVVDPTGAGDAFGSGMVSYLSGKKNFTFQDFFDSMQAAMVWASYACGTFGGSSECPGKRALNEFIQRRKKQLHKFVEVKDRISAAEFLNSVEYESGE